ncbi:MAG: cation-translocating P-type ATPase [Chloroflexi bacterium]|nr:cation-translocating P-type ATPase [Chloroflexota bacterium]
MEQRPSVEWYRLPVEEVLRLLETNPETGLSEEEAQRRLAIYGPNQLVERGPESPWRIFLEQFQDPLVILLLLSAGISAFLGDYKEAIAIMIIVILNAALGFSQEYRAEKAIAALKRLAVPVVKVLRDGQVKEIPAVQLVPGDIIFLEAGMTVPADARVIESVNLRTQEAALTGESEPVEKISDPLDVPNLPLGDRRNMVYMGTAVIFGRGKAVVVATGMSTELGRIAAMLQSVEREPTPLQRRLAQLSKGLAWAALVIVVVVFTLGVMRGEDLETMFLTAISMAVAAVPEGLPAVVTIALALGAQRMLRRKALIRKLPAVETLGSITVICSDKTGTLTENRMTVAVLDMAGYEEPLRMTELLERQRSARAECPTEPDWSTLPPDVGLLLLAAALCNDAVLVPRGEDQETCTAVGDPTEAALVLAAAQVGLAKPVLEQLLPRVAEVPFTSRRKRMTTVHRLELEAAARYPWTKPLQELIANNGDLPRYVAFTKGAVDVLLERSNRVWFQGQVLPLDESWRERIQAANDRFAAQGMRVLGVAARRLDIEPLPTAPEELERIAENDLVFLGLVGILDPPRPEAREAVATCKQAGIRPIMITGDHPLTARFIARVLGIIEGDNDEVITGAQLETMDDETLREKLKRVRVFARVSPEHKLRIVEALQTDGEIVAMTGDGVNDAPALKKADIGVAMGISGTDVAKEAADMILLDDNFATIVAAVEEGRVIYDNVRRFIQYTLSSNTGEILVMLLAPFLGMPLPLTPLQILWINLVTDGLPGLALTLEPAEEDVMRRPPYKPDESVFGRGLGRDTLWVGALMGLVTLLGGWLAWRAGHEAWQTILFTVLTLSQMGNALALRSYRRSLFQQGIFSNPALIGAVLLTLVGQFAVIYIPGLQKLFHTVPLRGEDFLAAMLLSTVVFWAYEAKKWLVRRGILRV